MKTTSFAVLACTILLAGLTPTMADNPFDPIPAAIAAQREHTEWVGRCLHDMETIKVGMTRAQLMKVFTTEGGLSSRTQEQFVYGGCEYFKVRVTFTPVSPSDGFFRDPNDKIASISEPIVQFTITD